MIANPFISSGSSAPPRTTILGGTEQDWAVAKVLDWFNTKGRRTQVFRLFGPAGTGKTTIARTIADQIGGTVLFAAFSAKAASVLRQKGNLNATTIHKLIYLPTDVDGKGKISFILNSASAVRSAALIIIDECSMVNAKMGRDLESFGIPILVLGDKAQLPPIEGAGYFTNAAAEFELTQIHRQAAGDPIVTLATRARAQLRLQVDYYGQSRVLQSRDLTWSDVIGADQVLAGTWSTVTYLNSRIRQILGRPLDEPAVGDKLVCRKNSAGRNLFNGEIWFVEHLKETKNGIIHMSIRSDFDDRQIDVAVDQRFFAVKSREEFEGLLAQRKGNDAFTFGYTLTAHQAQGSEWDRVVLFDESKTWQEDRSKWLYTGITRAAKSILVVQP